VRTVNSDEHVGHIIASTVFYDEPGPALDDVVSCVLKVVLQEPVVALGLKWKTVIRLCSDRPFERGYMVEFWFVDAFEFDGNRLVE